MQQQRPSFAPAKKTAPPYLMGILLLVLAVVAVVFVVKFLGRNEKPEIVEVDGGTNDKDFQEIKRDFSKARGLFHDAMRLKDAEQPEEFNKACKKGKDALANILDRLDTMLDPVRLPNGQLPQEYSGYDPIYTECQTLLGDLAKSSGFFGG